MGRSHTGKFLFYLDNSKMWVILMTLSRSPTYYLNTSSVQPAVSSTSWLWCRNQHGMHLFLSHFPHFHWPGPAPLKSPESCPGLAFTRSLSEKTSVIVKFWVLNSIWSPLWGHQNQVSSPLGLINYLRAKGVWCSVYLASSQILAW